MSMKQRYLLASGLVLMAAACSKAPDDVPPDNSELSEDQQIEEGAQTLEEAADKAMQIEIDSLNNVAPRTDDESDGDADSKGEQSTDKEEASAEKTG
jgi:hypothetical protein